MSEYLYPLASLRKEGLGSVIGMGFSGAFAALTLSAPVQLSVALAVFTLFAAYGGRAAWRATIRLTPGRSAITLTAAGMRRTIGWDELAALKLKYFTTRRDGEAGWMQLRLSNGNQQIKIDSSLAGFDRILRAAVAAAAKNGAALPDATRANLAACGFDTSGGDLASEAMA